MPEFSGSVSYPYNWTVVFDATVRALQGLRGWSVRQVNQPYGYVVASVDFNFWSYGENITIQVTQPSEDESMVTLLSSSKFALVDFGKNRKNIEKLFREIDGVLYQLGYRAEGVRHAAPSAAQAASPPAGSAGVPAIRCINCGAQQSAGARFCTGCGQEIQAGGQVDGSPGGGEGTRAAKTCPSCGKSSAPDARFCTGCGSELP